jgi:hypothetical protein
MAEVRSPQWAASRAPARSAPAVRVHWAAALPVVLSLVLFLAVSVKLWLTRAAQIAPRHRAEALCFALASPPAFRPPMTVEPSSALVRGRFAPRTPVVTALGRTIGFERTNVLRQWAERVGDYDIEILWLKLADGGPDRHWLVVGWMEGSDLAFASFRFGTTGPDLSPADLRWGDELLDRILVPRNFEAGSLPPVRLSPDPRGTLPVFGPKRIG